MKKKNCSYSRKHKNKSRSNQTKMPYYEKEREKSVNQDFAILYMWELPQEQPQITKFWMKQKQETLTE